MCNVHVTSTRWFYVLLMARHSTISILSHFTLHPFEKAISHVEKKAFDLLNKKFSVSFFLCVRITRAQRHVVSWLLSHKCNYLVFYFSKRSWELQQFDNIYPLNLNNIARQWPLATPNENPLYNVHKAHRWKKKYWSFRRYFDWSWRAYASQTSRTPFTNGIRKSIYMKPLTMTNSNFIRISCSMRAIFVSFFLQLFACL